MPYVIPGYNADQERPISATDVLKDGIRLIDAKPTVIFVFVAAGLAMTALEQVLLADPVPVDVVTVFGVEDLEPSLPILPADQRRARTPIAALYGLRPLWLLERALLGLLGIAITVTASAIAVSGWEHGGLRVGLRSIEPRAIRAALGYAVALAVGLVALDILAIAIPILAVVAFAVALFLAARFFLAFPLIVRGHSILSALAESSRRVSGSGLSVAIALLVLAVFAGLLATVPIVGGGLSVSLAGSVQVAAMTVATKATDPPDAAAS